MITLPYSSNAARLLSDFIRPGSRLAGRSSRALLTAAFVGLSLWISVSIAGVAGYASASMEVAAATLVLITAVLSPCAALVARLRGVRDFFLGSCDEKEKRLDEYLELVETAIRTLPCQKADEKVDKLFEQLVETVGRP